LKSTRLERGAGRGAILLADRASEARDELARSFRWLGYEVWGVEDPDRAIDVALVSHARVVIADPAVWRIGVVRVVRALRAALPHAAIAVLTACGSVAHAVGALRSGATTYLTKPMTAQQILGSLCEPDLREEPREGSGEPPPASSLTLDDAIWQYISFVFETAGSLSEAARRLGVERRSLRRMMVKYAPKQEGRPAGRPRAARAGT
jgi:two-component system response regulator RegA